MAKVTYRKKKLFPLYAASDESKVKPILDALKAQGFPIAADGETPNKGGVMLLFLSEALETDTSVSEAFFAADGKGIDAVPVNLDGSTPPKLLEHALYARNTIFAARYSVEELCARIAEAKPFEVKRKPLPLILASAAALLIVAGLVVLLTRLLKSPDPNAGQPTAAPIATPAPTPVPVIPAEAGLRPEDLESVYELIITGDKLNYSDANDGYARRFGLARLGAEHWASHSEQDGAVHWYSNEDGHEIELAEWDDLDFLRYMPNVKFITLVCVKGTLPDLSGLEKLENVELFECDIPDIEGLKNTHILNFGYSGRTLSDFSPLNDCKKLTDMNVTLFDPIPQDLSSLWAPNVSNVRIDTDSSARTVDLSGLEKCNLYSLRLDSLPLRDLRCLAGCRELHELELVNLPDLNSVDGLQDHPYLTRLFVDYNVESLRDMSALADNTSLQHVDLHNEAMNDLSWLSNAQNLDRLELWYTRGVRNLHGLENHVRLHNLYIEGLEHLTDISALESCMSLNQIFMGKVFDLADISPIVKLPHLRDLQIYGSQLNDVNFLSDIVNKDYFSFGIAEVEDWSGLTAIRYYEYLNVTDRSGSALPYLKDAKINHFELWSRSGVSDWSREPLDWSQFPNVTEELRLHGVVSLSGMPALSLHQLYIDESQLLTSLDGIQNLVATRYGTLYLDITGCPRLTDWSALEGLKFSQIYLDSTFTLPDFSTFEANMISLCTPVDLYDLHCFDGINPDKAVSIELFQTMDVTDLSPLYAIKNGNVLKVPAHLQEQAQLLVESGNFRDYEVVYPDEWWAPAEFDVMLLSLDELDTLPSAVLARVNRLYMIGDVLFSPDDYRVDQQWEWDENTKANVPIFTLISNDGNEAHNIEIENRGTMTDFSKLAALTGLEELSMQYQSLESVDGVQNLQNLWMFEVAFTPSLVDASPVFTLQSLEELHLQYTGVTSIQGLQNLQNLRWMDLNGLALDDLTPLGGIPDDCDFSFDFPLMTAEEFFALPDSVLAHLSEIGFFGGYVMQNPWGDYWFEEDWHGDTADLYLHSNGTNERIPLEPGSITDLGFLNRLKSLRGLYLYDQPIQSLDGIEIASDLNHFNSCWTEISDLSPLFEMSELENVFVNNTHGVTSIEGIQNLKHLRELYIGGSNVTDLSPLSEIDYSFAETPDWDGNVPHFSLGVDNMADTLPPEQYQYLSAVPYFGYLNVWNTDFDLWFEATKNTPILNLSAGNCGIDNERLKLLCEAHPELEELALSWNKQSLSDLTPLLNLSNLRRLQISHDLERAIRSLGDGFRFQLDIE